MTVASQDEATKAKATGKDIPAPPEKTAPKEESTAAAPPPEAPPAPEPVLAEPEPAEEIDDGLTWIDELTELGRRVAVCRRGEEGGVVVTYEEVLSAVASEKHVREAKERLLKRLVVD